MDDSPVKFVFSFDDMRKLFEDLLKLYDEFEEGEFRRAYPHLNELLDTVVETNIFNK
ncbi:MAG: hypothetical protein HY541_05105 [Deltaproteobacteria bacterium]|nr:hypothetical protein [Deltaproteobacteria bacterium]